jgi:hypothetical protein
MSTVRAFDMGMVVGICIGLVIAGAGAYILFKPSSPASSSIPTVSASSGTDYFSLSCTILRETANQDLATSLGMGFGDSAAYQVQASALIQLMQLKGCTVP